MWWIFDRWMAGCSTKSGDNLVQSIFVRTHFLSAVDGQTKVHTFLCGAQLRDFKGSQATVTSVSDQTAATRHCEYIILCSVCGVYYAPYPQHEESTSGRHVYHWYSTFSLSNLVLYHDHCLQQHSSASASALICLKKNMNDL